MFRGLDKEEPEGTEVVILLRTSTNAMRLRGSEDQFIGTFINDHSFLSRQSYEHSEVYSAKIIEFAFESSLKQNTRKQKR